ncbi:MAG: hypothetical protein JWO31_2114 [Phycisphaerales bacterium]|nr:hypothetical protein [Phycisphaerales bacterium]
MGLAFEVYGAAPVQADGTIGNRQFYFRAKHSNWTFEMADDLGELPTDTGNNAVFSVEGRYRSAGDMSLDEASKIIEACAKLYVGTTLPNL